MLWGLNSLATIKLTDLKCYCLIFYVSRLNRGLINAINAKFSFLFGVLKADCA